MFNYFNSTTQQMMGVKLMKCHYPLLNLLTTSSTLNLVEKIMQKGSIFSYMNVKPKVETIATLITEITPISKAFPYSSSWDFCEYYGQTGHGYLKTLVCANVPTICV